MSTKQPDVQELATMLRRLEREVRLWKRLVSLLLLLVALLVCGGSKLLQDVPDVVRASRGFEVRDKEGRIRSFLGVAKDGVNALSLMDDLGHRRIDLGSSVKGEFGLYVQDDNDSTRFFAGFRDGEYSVYLYDKNKIARLAITLDTQSGNSGLSLLNEKGAERLSLGQVNQVDGTKMVGLSIQDEAENERVQIYNRGAKESAIRFIDGAGKDRHGRIALGLFGGEERRARFSISGNDVEERVIIDVGSDNAIRYEAKSKDNRTFNLVGGK